MQSLFEQAKQVIPGGVNSPVRAFSNLGREPVFVKSAKAACLYDVNDKAYIDYIGSWGPMILGHADADVVTAVQAAAANSLSFGTPTEIETEMAAFICAEIDAIDKVRFVSSGTEATMSAIRLARGMTGRDLIVKFEGCYHGHADSLLVKAGSGLLTLGVPSSAGVPEVLANLTATLTFNDSNGVRDFFRENGDQIACVIVEPIAGNMNCILPEAGFLQTLREVCDASGSVLIFDEVMTGFRVAMGGATQHYGVKPDLITLGKILGGGMPVGAFGGARHIMDVIAPDGPVYQAGTLSGNPLAMSAGLATLRKLKQLNPHEQLHITTARLCKELRAIAASHDIPFTTNQVGGMFGLFFNEHPQISRYQQVVEGNGQHFQQFFRASLDAGIYYAPSAFEAAFVSVAHDDSIIQQTIDAAEIAMAQITA